MTDVMGRSGTETASPARVGAERASLFHPFSGRMRRRSYAVALIWQTVILAVLVNGLVLISSRHAGSVGAIVSGPDQGAVAVSLVLICVVLFWSLSAVVRRLHDIGAPGAFAVFSLAVPVLSHLLIALWHGQPGTNLYGPDPRA